MERANLQRACGSWDQFLHQDSFYVKTRDDKKVACFKKSFENETV
jgi:hypothetical protein